MQLIYGVHYPHCVYCMTTPNTVYEYNVFTPKLKVFKYRSKLKYYNSYTIFEYNFLGRTYKIKCTGFALSEKVWSLTFGNLGNTYGKNCKKCQFFTFDPGQWEVFV